jgi:hypothetical protein
MKTNKNNVSSFKKITFHTNKSKQVSPLSLEKKRLKKNIYKILNINLGCIGHHLVLTIVNEILEKNIEELTKIYKSKK